VEIDAHGAAYQPPAGRVEPSRARSRPVPLLRRACPS
jgi:hypothetical protein